ncbi:unnamed protein product, partial [Durusdinium trenchii]
MDALPARRPDRINALHPAMRASIRCHQMHFARIRMADGKFPIVLQLVVNQLAAPEMGENAKEELDSACDEDAPPFPAAEDDAYPF